ncbi:MAG: SMC-Scp complex subunit ScpB [bacterium]
MRPETETPQEPATAEIEGAAVVTVAPESPAAEAAAPEALAPVTVTLDATVEALLFSSEEPLAAARLAQLAEARKGDVLEAIDRLNVFYAETGRAFRIAPLAGGFQLVTTPEHADVLGRLHKDRASARLSRAALETLSIVAFKQPVTRAEIDAIRGVSASDGVVRHLMERRLVRIAGRAEAPGRPLLYGTTREFLAHFGLHALADLPRTSELAALLAGAPRPVVSDEELPVVPDEALRAGSDPELPVEPESHSVEESDDGGFPPSQ